jgi:hypothetical protein
LDVCVVLLLLLLKHNTVESGQFLADVSINAIGLQPGSLVLAMLHHNIQRPLRL